MPWDKALSVLAGAGRVLDEISATTQEAAGGLTRLQLMSLSIVAGNEGIRLADLAERLGVTPSTAVRSIDRLTAAKLVRRRENPDDRREVRLTVTKRGSESLDRALDAGRAAMGAILTRLGEESTADLVTALGRFLDAAGYEPESLVFGSGDEDEDDPDPADVVDPPATDPAGTDGPPATG